MKKEALFTDLKGKFIHSIQIGDETTIEAGTSTDYMNDHPRITYKLYHDQDCCESVNLVKVDGCVKDILDNKVVLAEEDAGCKEPEGVKYQPSDCFTWSKYTLKTENGELVLWYLGESNGYYSETMTFVETDRIE